MTDVLDLDRVVAHVAGQVMACAVSGERRPDPASRLADLVPTSSYQIASLTLEAEIRLTEPLRLDATTLGPVRFALQAGTGARGPLDRPAAAGLDDLLIALDARGDGLVRISRWASAVQAGRRTGGWSERPDDNHPIGS